MPNRPRRSSSRHTRASDVSSARAARKLARRVLALRSLHPARLRSLRQLKSRKPWTRKRALRWALLPLFLLLLFIGGNTFIRQRLDVDSAVRRSILPELRRQLGRDIEVGRIESDYVSRVTLHDVVIGRNPKLAPGALARAKSIQLELDLVALALGRAQGDPLSALHSVVLNQPQILLERDTRGIFNWADLWKGKKTTGARWTGLIVVQNGRMWLRDATFRSLRGRALLADLQGVSGRARFNGDAPVSFSGAVSSTQLGDKAATLSNLQSNGTVAPDGRRFNLNLRWPQTQLAQITDYLLPNGDVKLQSGSAAGGLHVAWDASWPVRARWLYRGELALQNISGQAKQLRLPGSASPEPVQNLTGNLRFSNDALETAKLTGRVLDTALQVSGRVALPSSELPRPAFNVIAQSASWNIWRLKQLTRSVPALRGFDLQTATANAVVRASGDTQNPSISTQFSLPNFTLRGGNSTIQNAILRGNSLRGRVEYDAKSKRTFASLNSTGAFLSQPQFGTWRSRELNAVISSNNGRNLSTDVRAVSLQAETPQGNVQSRDVTAKIVSPDGRSFSGLVRAAALDARSSQGNLRSGDFVATFTSPNTRDLSGAIRATDFTAQSTQGNLRGPLLTGVARYASTQITANVAMPRFVLDTWQNRAMPVFAQGSDLRAAIQTSGNTQNLLANNLIINAQSDAINFKHAQYGMGRASQFVAAFSQNGNARRVQLNGSRVALRPNRSLISQYQNVLRGGVFQASNVQLAATSSGATWNGLTQFSGVDASRFNLASLGNNALLSNLGNLSGAARFWNVGGSEPMVKGRFALSQAQIQGENLRNLRGNISFANDTLRLTDATAQTRWSTLRAEALIPLRGGQTQFRLVAPRFVLGGAQLRPFLAPLGLALRGDAIGRLAVKNSLSSTRNAPLQLSFDLDLPSAALVPLQSGRDALRLRNARLRGSGLWSASAWSGTVKLSATRGEIGSGRLRGVNLPSWVSGTATRDLQLEANGRATRSASGTWAMNGSAQVQAASAQTPLPGSKTPLVWQNARATLALAPGRISVPRFSGQVPSWQLPGGDASTRALVTGHLEQRGTAWSGQLLAENLSAPRFANWTQSITGLALPLDISRGVAFARVDLTGSAEQPQFDAQLRVLDGALQKNNSVFPLDSARFVFRNLNLRRLTTGNARTVSLDEATIWSRGGRIAANGTISLAQAPTLNLQTRLDGVRVADAAQFAAQLATPRGTVRVANLTGLLSGDLNVSGTVSQPRVTGRAGLRLARVLGADFDEVTGDVNYDSSGGGRFALTNLTGRVADAALTGDFNIKLGEGTWLAKLQARGARTERALRLVEQLSGQTTEEQDSLPLRGVLNASLDVSGSLRDEEGNFALRPTDGKVDVSTDTLRWRGRPLGALHAGLELENGIAHISDLALLRAADGNSSSDSNASTQETPAVSVIRVTGDVPLDANAPGLDASVNVENARLSLVRSTLEEVESILEARGSNPANFERLMLRLRALPEDLEGELALKAQLRGQWSDPTLAVDFAIREVRAGSQPLPAVDAALNFEDGNIAIRRLDLRQTFGTGDDESETVIRLAEGGRIEPNGNITLDGEILNANLSQLATWLPDLRGADGQAVVRGDLGLFVFQVRGNTSDPQITGSIEAENLEYHGYTFDRLRLARFDLANEQLSVEPGALTIRKGRFQSSSAWGRIPWTWGEDGETPGPRRDAPMEVHLPLETRDFGALAGTFIPALANVDASSFKGSIDVTGTLANPQLAGAVTFENAAFRADPVTLPFAFGVTGLTGAMRFVNGNQVLVEGIHGKLAKASDIKAPSTGNPPATQRDPRAVRRERRDQVPPPDLAGDFTLDGRIALDLDAENFTAPGASLAAHRYDLKLSLRKAEYSSNEFSGLRDVSLDVNWQTGEGPARLSQNLNWNFSARGRDRERRGAAKGELTSQAKVVLASNFGTGLNALLRSRFDGNIRVRALPLYWRGVGEGVLGGDLKLDNVPQGGVPLAPVPVPPPRLPDSPSVAQSEQLQVTASLKPIVYDPSAHDPLALFWPVKQNTPTKKTQNRKAQQNRAPRNQDEDNEPSPDPSTAGLLRISGDLEISQTEVTGLPGGENTASTTRVPDGPFFDVSLTAGRDVRFTTSNLRAEFVGEMSIAGTPRTPAITGRFETRDGQIRFPRAATRITEGELRLAITRDPLSGSLRTRAEIDVTATGLAGRYQIAAGQYVPYRITVTLRGPLDFGDASTQNLRVDVVSDPPLTKDEAFAQLTGTSVRDLSGGTLDTEDVNEAYARSVISLLSAPLFTGIERTLEEALGLNSITLDYRFNEPLSVQFGKALTDRVYLSYRRSLSPDRPGGITSFDLRIDYRLKNDILFGFSLSEQGRKQLTIGKTFRF